MPTAFGLLLRKHLLQGKTGTNWLRPSLADELFPLGQPLSTAKMLFGRMVPPVSVISRRPSRLSGSVQSSLSGVAIDGGTSAVRALTRSGRWTLFGASVKSPGAVRPAPAGRSP